MIEGLQRITITPAENGWILTAKVWAHVPIQRVVPDIDATTLLHAELEALLQDCRDVAEPRRMEGRNE